MRYFEHKLKTPLTSDARLVCYIPDNSEEIEPHRKRRAIIICPGGSYAKTSDREAEPIDGLCGVHSAIQLCSQEIS